MSLETGEETEWSSIRGGVHDDDAPVYERSHDEVHINTRVQQTMNQLLWLRVQKIYMDDLRERFVAAKRELYYKPGDELKVFP